MCTPDQGHYQSQSRELTDLLFIASVLSACPDLDFGDEFCFSGSRFEIIEEKGKGVLRSVD